MKKIIALLLLIAMLSASFSALAVTREYSMNEMIIRQLDFGSGMKGTANFEISGTAEWLNGWQCLTGVPVNIRLIGNNGGWQVKLYAEDESGKAVGSTWLNTTENSVDIVSDLIPDKKIHIATNGDLLNALFGSGNETDSFYSMVANILMVPGTTWNEKWESAIAPLSSWMDIWLGKFSGTPAITGGQDNQRILTITYTIPAADLKKGIIEMLEQVFTNNDLMYLLRSVATENQKNSYLNPNLLWYYKQIINDLPITGNTVLSRVTTVKGEEVSTTIEFPVAMQEEGFTRLSVYSNVNGMLEIALTGELNETSVSMTKIAESGDTTTYQGEFKHIGAEKTSIRAQFELAYTESYEKEENTRQHVIHQVVISAKPVESDTDVLQFEPVVITLYSHQSAKNSQTSPVTTILSAEAEAASYHVKTEISVVTTSQVKAEQVDADKVCEILMMTEEERNDLLNQITYSLQMLCEELTSAIPMPQ